MTRRDYGGSILTRLHTGKIMRIKKKITNSARLGKVFRNLYWVMTGLQGHILACKCDRTLLKSLKLRMRRFGPVAARCRQHSQRFSSSVVPKCAFCWRKSRNGALYAGHYPTDVSAAVDGRLPYSALCPALTSKAATRPVPVNSAHSFSTPLPVREVHRHPSPSIMICYLRQQIVIIIDTDWRVINKCWRDCDGGGREEDKGVKGGGESSFT
jgi:hypothetical protein